MLPSTAALRTSLIAGALALSACLDASGPQEPDPSAVSVAAPQQPEDEQAALARAVRGFGGLFLDESGVPTVYLTDPG